MHERRRCLTYLLLGFIWLYVLIMSRAHFRVNLLSIVAWISRSFFARNRCSIYLSVLLQTKWLWVGIQLRPLRFIFDDIFGPKKNDFFCPVFVFQRSMPIGMLKYILYFNNESLKISWISLHNSILGLKNDFHNTVLNSLAGRSLIFFNMPWIDTRSRRQI